MSSSNKSGNKIKNNSKSNSGNKKSRSKSPKPRVNKTVRWHPDVKSPKKLGRTRAQTRKAYSK